MNNPAFEPLGFGLIESSMAEAASAQFSDYQGGFVLGASPGTITGIFQWGGIAWTPSLILSRFAFFGVAALVTLLAALFFDRFDPSRRKVAKARKKGKKELSAQEDDAPRPPARAIRLLPLKESVSSPSFLPLFRAEIKLLFKGRRWLWYAMAVGLILASLLNPSDITRTIILPIAWVWPIMLWSSIGNREIRHNT